MAFEDNRALPQLFGDGDANLRRIEERLGVTIASRGEMVNISGDGEAVDLARAILHVVYEQLRAGKDVSAAEFDAVIRLMEEPEEEAEVAIAPVQDKPGGQAAVTPAMPPVDNVFIATPRKRLSPRSRRQAYYMRELMTKNLTFASGPAGTGKTYVAVAAAVAKFAAGDVERIILSRPAVEAGENLGFLPGDLKEKIDPYLRPMYDALYDMLPAEKIQKYMEVGQIEIAPLAFMRGRTLSHAYVVLDEAQNTSAVQMKMFLTRLGEGTSMAVTGDLSQTDLPKSMKSGFRDALEKVEGIDEVAVVHFGGKDVIRHPLTAKIVEAYDRIDKPNKWDTE